MNPYRESGLRRIDDVEYGPHIASDFYDCRGACCCARLASILGDQRRAGRTAEDINDSIVVCFTPLAWGREDPS